MRDANSLVSIMIPVYNRENIISETLDCAIHQTYTNIEIIVFDNYSTDSTWSILEEFALKDKRIKIFRNPANIGPVMNWKKCIEKLKGDYTKILWSDDLISNDFIEKSLKLFDKDTSFVMSGVRIFNSNDNKTLSLSKYQNKQIYTKEEYLNDILFYNKNGFPVSPCCALFRTDDIKTSFIEQIPNKENLDFKKFGAGNDLLLFLITASKYKYIKCLNEYSTHFRSHPSSLTISNKLNLYYEYAISFFIINFYNDQMINYKSKLYLLCRKIPEYKILFNTLNCKVEFSCLIKNYFSLINYKIIIKLGLKK